MSPYRFSILSKMIFKKKSDETLYFRHANVHNVHSVCLESISSGKSRRSVSMSHGQTTDETHLTLALLTSAQCSLTA